MGFEVDGGEAVEVTVVDDGDDDSPNPEQAEIVESIMNGKGEAVYVAGWLDGGLVTSLATRQDDREMASAIAANSTAGMAVFVSGPAVDSRTFTTGTGRDATRARRDMLEAVGDDVFDRMAEVDMPHIPHPSKMAPETLAVVAARKMLEGQRQMRG